MNFRKQFQTQHTGFQMAPMIDIVFQLLIFWVLVSVYAQWETKLGLDIPTASSGQTAQRSPVELIVNLDREGRIYINNSELSVDELAHVLQVVASQAEGHPVIIRADKQTGFQAVIGVLDVCRKLDIWNVSFATLPPNDKPK
jgi:biopolymer transport protein ExbD